MRFCTKSMSFLTKIHEILTKVWVDKTQILTRLPQAYIQVFMVWISKFDVKFQNLMSSWG